VCFRLRARSRSTSPASGEQITHWVDHSGSDPNPLRVCFGLVLLLCDDIRHKQVLLAVGPFSRYPEAQVAQYLASSPAVGRRFMAIQGDLAHVAWQLSHDFPSLLCDLLVFIPDHIMPGAESEAEEKLRNLILCAGTLTRLRGDVSEMPQTQREGEGEAKQSLLVDDRRRQQEKSLTRLFVLDGWPCRHARFVSFVLLPFFVDALLYACVYARAVVHFYACALACVRAQLACAHRVVLSCDVRMRTGAHG
jgi:hypothetical protein